MSTALSKLAPRERLLLGVVSILIFGIVALVIWAGHAQARARESTPGPMTQDSAGRVWIAVGESLAVLSADGELLNLFELETLGIEPPVAALAPYAEGQIAVGSRSTGMIHLLRDDGTPAGSVDLRRTDAGALFGAFHLLFDEERGVLIVADTSNHRIIALDRNGTVQAQAGTPDNQPGPLFFPNALALAHGYIFVANTNRHEITVLDDKLEILDGQSFAVSASNPDHTWPVFIGTDPLGQLYVTLHDSLLETGSLLRYAPDWPEPFEFSIAPTVQPAALLVRKDDVLVSDEVSYRLLRFTHDAVAIDDFGDTAFRDMLARVKARARLYPMLVRAGRWLLFGCLLVLLVLLFIARRRERAPADSLPTAQPIPRSAFLQRFVFVLPLTTVLLLSAVTIPLVLSQVVRAFFLPLPVWIFTSILVIVALAIVLGFAWLGGWWHRRQLLRGRYRDTLQFLSAAIMRKFGKVVKLLAGGETIIEHGMARAGRGPALILLTPSRLLVIALSQYGNRILRIQAFTRSDLRAEHIKMGSAWRKLFVSSTRVSFRTSGRSAPLIIEFSDPQSAKTVFEALNTGDLQASSAMPMEHCPACAATLLEPGPCPACGYAAPPSWPATLLSALYPGLGQYYNQDLLKGTLFLAVFTVLALPTLRYAITWLLRQREISEFAFAEYATYAVLVWIVAMLDAHITAGRLRKLGWGLV